MMNQHRSNDDFSTTLHPVIMTVPESDRQLRGREMVAALSGHARDALTHAARISGLALGPLEKDEKGVPLPSNNHYWSIAHKKTMVAAVVATRPVGIDIEVLKPCNPSLYRHIANDKEWALAPEIGHRYFFRFWTAKEAVLKAVGIGFAGLSRCRIHKIVDDTHLVLSYDNSMWPIAQYWTEDDHLVAVTAIDADIAWHLK
jgi:4'-phosphopantetheinyl transferase